MTQTVDVPSRLLATYLRFLPWLVFIGGFVCVPVSCQQVYSVAPAKSVGIDPLSVKSLLLTLLSKGTPIGTATGFVVQKGGKSYLATNWHVLKGRRPDNEFPMDPQGRIPDEVAVLHNRKGFLGQWVSKVEALNDPAGKSKIIEHSTGRAVDVVLLPLTALDDVELYATQLELKDVPMRLVPTGNVSIIGFPFGHSSFAGLPIWKTGAIASDPDINYDGTPQLLVDTTARPGMSGSPVYARRSNGYQAEDGNYVMNLGSVDKFIGVFAGSIDGSSEIGRVWKAQVLVEMLNKLP